KVHNDHASDIIEGMWGNLGKQFYINSPNRGAVTNLPDDAFLELRSDIDMRGPRPQPFGAFPRGLLALQHQVLDTHELTAEAAVTGDRAILRRAMLTDPICNNIGDADACIADLLKAEREALPAHWFRRK
ncbi:MAG: glycoside hydrolase family 4, partial [Planctomycetes bacterium]|nr:glycoside hydrolase family 4 [Planctomycetota bacterium]